MASETMTSAERLDAALAFDKPDRVPVVPRLVKSTAAAYCGVSQAAAEQDMELALQCMLKIFDDIGGWDAPYLDIPDTAEVEILACQFPLQWMIPGVDLPEDALLQCHEKEVLTVDDYSRIIEEGFLRFYYDEYVYRIHDFPRDSVDETMRKQKQFYDDRCVPEWNKRLVSAYTCFLGNHPFFELSLARSLERFIEDVYYRPHIVLEAIECMTVELITKTVSEIRQSNIKPKCAEVVEERVTYFPPEVFERFWWPYSVQFVEAMWSEGVVTSFHLDTDWGRYLQYFKRDLPSGSYMVQLDSTTDIVAAKELLRGHALFHGDVPATLQSLGSAHDVEVYCKMLIDKVGYEGGFILGTGCDTPPDCKFENLLSMVETAKKYELSRS